MPSVAVPVTIMVGLGVTAGIAAHWKSRHFWYASVLGGLLGALLWMVGALALVVPTEGLDWAGLKSLYLVFKAFAIVSAITLPAAMLAGVLVRWMRGGPMPRNTPEPSSRDSEG